MDRPTGSGSDLGSPPRKMPPEDMRMVRGEGILIPLYLDWIERGRPMRAMEGE